MATEDKKVKTDDASGRGTATGYKVNFPARMRSYTEEEIATVVDVMRNAEGQTQGANLEAFQEAFKAYSGANHAFAVDNCTNALRMAAILCRLQPGDEVIISAYTFCATAIPFGKTGAKIVWADIDLDTWTADPKDIERKITAKTKAIVVVHILGMPANMSAIMALAKKHNLRVVEDCAQAPGASIDGKHVGTFGDPWRGWDAHRSGRRRRQAGPGRAPQWLPRVRGRTRTLLGSRDEHCRYRHRRRLAE